MTKSNPLVSVIAPAWNAEKYIEESVKSILSQTYQNIELLIIDDCSTDKTWELIKKIASLDKRVRLYRNEKNLGIGGNRNLGITLAKGDLIAWQDADDISTPDRIQKQVEFLKSNPDVGVVGGFLEFFGENMKASVRRYAESDQDLRKNIFKYNPVAQPVSMFRRECFEKLGSYDSRYRVSEDLEMLFRTGTKYKFGNVQKVLLKYRQYGDSLTFQNLRKMEKTTIKLRLLYSKRPEYSPTILDYIYNLLQLCSIYIMPSKLKIKIFNLIRNA